MADWYRLITPDSAKLVAAAALWLIAILATHDADPGPRFLALALLGANVVYYLLQVIQ